MDDKENLIQVLKHSADGYARIFWVWASVSGVVGYFWGWWGVLPAFFGLLAAFESGSASYRAAKLEKQQ